MSGEDIAAARAGGIAEGLEMAARCCDARAQGFTDLAMLQKRQEPKVHFFGRSTGAENCATAIRALAVRATPEPQAWRDIAEARKDRTTIWAVFHHDIYPRIEPSRPDLKRWNGVQVPLRHLGIYEREKRVWDHGWDIAAPVGNGGFPDKWIAGWLLLPSFKPAPPPTRTAQGDIGEVG